MFGISPELLVAISAIVEGTPLPIPAATRPMQLWTDSASAPKSAIVS